MNPHPLFEKVKFETITGGDCIQMLHTGRYDDNLSVSPAWMPLKKLAD